MNGFMVAKTASMMQRLHIFGCFTSKMELLIDVVAKYFVTEINVLLNQV